MDNGFMAMLCNGRRLYEALCRPLCQESALPQPSLDILMFLAQNPDHPTAKDITRYRGLKRNLVSVHVDRLVRDGYLERQPIPGDRRQKKLVCTPKAQQVVEQGCRAQEEFYRLLTKGLPQAQLDLLAQGMAAIAQNIEEYQTAHPQTLQEGDE